MSLYLVAPSRSARMSMYSRCHLQQFRHELHRSTCSHWRPLWSHHICNKHPRWICLAAVSQEGLAVRFRPATDKDMPTAKQFVLQERMNPLGLVPGRLIIAESPDGEFAGMAQLEPLPAPGAAEFRSLIVAPKFRGRGVGSALVQHIAGPGCGMESVWITTIGRTVSWYERQGFMEVPASQVPWFLWFEFAAGTAVARLAANDRLVVMVRRHKGTNENG